MRLSGIQEKHVRFGYSAARECLRAVEVLLHPEHHAEQMPWLRDARRHVPRDLRTRMQRFDFFFSPQVEVFPSLWSDVKAHPFQTELHALRANAGAYTDAVVRRLSRKQLVQKSELQRMRNRSWLKPASADFASKNPGTRGMLDAFIASPSQSLREFCSMLEQVHACVVEPYWDSISLTLREDVAMRRNVLRKYGIAAVLRTLAPEVGVSRSRRGITLEFGPGDAELHADSRCSITLTPSFFTWPHVQAFTLKTPRALRCTIAYPLPPLTARTGPAANGDRIARTCAAIGDPMRLRILELLKTRELSTRELAGYLKIAEPLVSRHLRTLHEAELVSKRRSGYFVLYRIRTDTVERALASIGMLART